MARPPAGPGGAAGLSPLALAPEDAGPPPDDGAPVSAELRALVRAVERRWAASGQRRPASRGLLEHARAVEAGTNAPPEAEADRRVVEAYYRARFGAMQDSRSDPLV